MTDAAIASEVTLFTCVAAPWCYCVHATSDFLLVGVDESSRLLPRTGQVVIVGYLWDIVSEILPRPDAPVPCAHFSVCSQYSVLVKIQQWHPHQTTPSPRSL